MRSALFGLFLIFGLLLSSAHASALAHIDAGDDVILVTQMIDGDHHGTGLLHDAADTDPDGKGDISQHHHCSVGVAIGIAAMCDRADLGRLSLFPALATAMSSLTGSPPTEPPSA